MRLVATKTLRYATRRLLPGDQFDTRKDSDGRILIATGRARHINDRDLVELEPPPATVVAKARKRPVKADPFDHDEDGSPGGSTSGGSGDDMKALRAEYFDKLGKRAFPGWDEDELRRRMAEVAES